MLYTSPFYNYQVDVSLDKNPILLQRHNKVMGCVQRLRQGDCKQTAITEDQQQQHQRWQSRRRPAPKLKDPTVLWQDRQAQSRVITESLGKESGVGRNGNCPFQRTRSEISYIFSAFCKTYGGSRCNRKCSGAGAVAQHTKLPLMMPAFHISVGKVPVTLLPIQLHANAPGKATEDGPST